MTATIRDGRVDDMPAIAAMAEARRVRYQDYEPLFWKKAAMSHEMGRMFLTHLIGLSDTLCLIAEQDGVVVGFLIATPARVPPVFEPGPTAMIDDFCVARR